MNISREPPPHPPHPHRLCHSLSQLKLVTLPGVLAFKKKKGLNMQSRGSLIVPFLVLEHKENKAYQSLLGPSWAVRDLRRQKGNRNQTQGGSPHLCPRTYLHCVFLKSDLFLFWPCDMQNISSPDRDQTYKPMYPAVEAQTTNHWTGPPEKSQKSALLFVIYIQ